MKTSDRLVLDALHREARNWLTPAQWQEVEKAVVDAGGILAVDGFARQIIEKAARQSFGGDRSAAGRYAAGIRWGKGGGSSGAGGAAGGAGAKPTINASDYGTAGKAAAEAQAEAKASGSAQNAKDIDEAVSQLGLSQKRDAEGDKFGAWEAASQAQFLAGKVAERRGVGKAIKRFNKILTDLVLRLTDKFYGEAA